MKAVGAAKLKFSGCTTNQAGCTSVTIDEAQPEFESVEGLKEKMGEAGEAQAGMGLEFRPQFAGLTTMTFNGTCGMHAFGPILLKGGMTATAEGKPQGMGAKDVFVNEQATFEGTGSSNGMSSLTADGFVGYLEGTLTIKGENGNPLVLTTS